MVAWITVELEGGRWIRDDDGSGVAPSAGSFGGIRKQVRIVATFKLTHTHSLL